MTNQFELVETNRKMNEIGEKPLVGWEVGFGMRKSELRTPWCRCYGRVAPMIGDGSLWVVLEIHRFIDT